MKSSVAVALLALVAAFRLDAQAVDSIRVGETNPGVEILFGTSTPTILMWDEDTSAGMSFEVTAEETSWTFGLASQLNLPTAGDAVQIKTYNNATLDLMSAGISHRFFVDSGGNFEDGESFSWWQDNAFLGATQIMNLDDTKLQIGGTLEENAGFDLAESFLRTDPVAPGELVAIVPGHPRAVRRATGAKNEMVLGPVSHRPGILMGGGAFSVEALEEQWGEEVAADYQRLRPALRAELLSGNSLLLQELQRLRSAGAQTRPLSSARDEEPAECTPSTACRRVPALPAALAAHALEEARHDFETRLEGRIMKRFFEDRFVSVALAGRVPVKVDASYAPILAGDRLTSSPRPGIAMKATEAGPVIGTALAGLAAGDGTIDVLVHRGWHGGAPTRLVSSDGSSSRRDDPRIAALTLRVAALEATLRELTEERDRPRVTKTTRWESPLRAGPRG